MTADGEPYGTPPPGAPAGERVTFWLVVCSAHGSAALAWAFAFLVQRIPDAQEDWAGAYGGGLAAGTAAFGAIVALLVAVGCRVAWRRWGRRSRVVSIAMQHLALAWFVAVAAAVTSV